MKQILSLTFLTISTLAAQPYTRDPNDATTYRNLALP